MQGVHTKREIATQVAAWDHALQVLREQQSAIKAFWNQQPTDYVVVTGCGSTHYLAMTAANLMQSMLKIPARAVPASELLFHPEGIYADNHKPLLVTISRSAETTETVQAAREFRQRYGDRILAITCYENRPLNEMAQLNLVATAGQEQSIAQTRSFSSMLTLAEGLVDILCDTFARSNTITTTTANAIEALQDFVKPYADPARFSQYYYLGSGPRFGLASEAMLKMKEMSLTHAEAYHPLEFRHGPMSMVDEQTLVVGLLGEEAHQAEKAVLTEMGGLGATVLSISPHADADYVIHANTDTPLLVQYMPILQWLAYSRAIQKNLNPDHPRNLESVVHLQNGV